MQKSNHFSIFYHKMIQKKLKDLVQLNFDLKWHFQSNNMYYKVDSKDSKLSAIHNDNTEKYFANNNENLKEVLDN